MYEIIQELIKIMDETENEEIKTIIEYLTLIDQELHYDD